MPSAFCSNPVCHLSLDIETNGNLSYYCASCNKHFCTHCVNHKTTNNREVNSCIYCDEVLSAKSNMGSPAENENIDLAVKKRLAMGEQGEKLQKAYCLKCLTEVCLPDLSVLANTPCTKCGTICYIDNYSKRYDGCNNTFNPTDESKFKYLQGFFAEYKALRDTKASNPLLGEFELNNWLFKNILTIHVFQVPEIIRKDYPDDATIIENAHKLFK